MSRSRPSIVPAYLVPLVTTFAVVFTLAVFFAQKIESPAMVILAPKLLYTTDKPTLSAGAYLVFDLTSGETLLEQQSDSVVPIASVTKLFAAAALVTNFDLQSTTSITWADIATEGESGKLHAGEKYSYQELLFPLLLESSNDAASTLVRATEGKLIIDMNAKVTKLGLTNTKFIDASGLSNGNVSTARDLKTLLSDAYSNVNHIFDIATLPQYIGQYSGWRNNNPVFLLAGYRGGKHGYTTAANRTLVAVFDEEINGHAYRLGYIVLGSADLSTDVKTLRAFINNSASRGSSGIMQ